MTWIQSWIDKTYLGFEKLFGISAVSRRWSIVDLGAQLTASSVAGYEIRVYCHERVYVRNFRFGGFLRRQYSTFRVFGRVSSDAPLALKSACELDVDLPRMRPFFVSLQLQQQAAVAAYLDLLARKIKDDHGTLNPNHV